MKTSLLMDIRYALGNGSNVLVLLIVGAVCGIGGQSLSVGVGVALGIFVVGMAVGFPVLDEVDGWEVARLTLPISRKDVVVGRYLCVLIMGVLGYFVALGVWIVGGLVATLFMPGSEFAASVSFDSMLLDCFYMDAFICCAAMLIAAVSYPVNFKWGATKAAQRVSILSAMAFALVIVVGGIVMDVNPELASFMSGLISADAIVFPLVSLVVCLAVFAVSCCVSVRFYQAREF